MGSFVHHFSHQQQSSLIEVVRTSKIIHHSHQKIYYLLLDHNRYQDIYGVIILSSILVNCILSDPLTYLQLKAY